MTNPSHDSSTKSETVWSRPFMPYLLLLGIGGVAAGYFLPGPKATVPVQPSDLETAAAKSAGQEQPAAANGSIVQEFALPTADVRDAQQAPSLTIGPNGQVYVCWESKLDDATKALMFTAASGAGSPFAEPRPIAKSGIFKSGGGGGRGGHERRMLPRLASFGNTVAVAWSDAPEDGSSVRLLLAESQDGGKTFGEPTTVHTSAEARPTFIGMAANSQGRIAASWLDCRSGPQKVYAAVRPDLATAFSPDALVCAGQGEQGVCPCCPTASLVAEDGTVFVAYRGQMDGYREIWIARAGADADGAFSEPIPVVSPTWKFDGCPHDGPALAAANGWLHVAWMDARSGRQRTYYARARFSDLARGTAKFESQELHAAGPGTQGNVKLAVDHAGRVHAVWEESLADEAPAEDAAKGGRGGHQHGPPTGAGRAIMHAVSAQGDGRFSPPEAVRLQPGRFQTRPNITCSADGQTAIAWTELDESGKRVVVVRQGSDSRLARHP